MSYQIKVPNPGEALDTWLLVRVNGPYGSEEITSVEMYLDAACTMLVYDDIDFATLSRSQQMKVSAALDTAEHAARQKTHAMVVMAMLDQAMSGVVSA